MNSKLGHLVFALIPKGYVLFRLLFNIFFFNGREKQRNDSSVVCFRPTATVIGIWKTMAHLEK